MRFGEAWRWLLLGLAVCLLGLAPPARAGHPMRIRVMSYNIRSAVDMSGKRNLPAVLQVVRDQAPDLLAVQEIDQPDLKPVSQAARLPYFVAVKGYSHPGKRVALFSRWPLSRFQTFPLAGTRKKRAFGRVVVDFGGIPISFYMVHLSREGLTGGGGRGLITEALGGGSRMTQMRSIVQALAQDHHRYRILAGDLNTFPLSGPYRLLAEYLQDAFPTMYTTGSFRYPDLPNPKIDHIFHSAGFKSLFATVVQQGQSDHFPVLAVLELRPLDAGLPRRVVENAQLALAARGYIPGSVDGVMDPGTRRAIARFQQAQGLMIDGCLSPQTLKKLVRWR